jgi:hypothetical protein
MSFFAVSIQGVLYRFAQLIAAPFVNPNVLWFALPLIISLIVIELYFGKYKKEELGWNTAVMNALVMIFTSLDLFQFVFNLHKGFLPTITSAKFLIALFVFLMGIGLFLLDFFHKLPKRIAFKISAHLPVNLTAYTALIIIYNDVPLDFMTIIALVILMAVFALMFYFIKLIEIEEREESEEKRDKLKFDDKQIRFNGKMKF